MTALTKLARRISTTTLLGALAVTLATYGTARTLADASRPASCQDRLVKVGGLDKEAGRLEKDTALVAKEDDHYDKSDSYDKESEYDKQNEFDKDSALDKPSEFDKDAALDKPNEMDKGTEMDKDYGLGVGQF